MAQPRTRQARLKSKPMPRKTVPKTDPSKTGKRSGTARAKCPKTHQKRGRLRTENGAPESGKKKLLAELWLSHGQGRHGQKASQCLGKRSRKRTPPKQGNAAARRAQNAQKRTKNEAGCGPKTGRLNPVRKSLWQSFGAASATPQMVPEARPSKRPNVAARRAGTACTMPKTDQKRGRLRSENGASEPCRKQPLAKLPTDRGHRCLEIWQFWRFGAKALADAVQLLRSGKL